MQPPPTWKEVGIPDIVVRSIHQIQPTYAMDCLISQLVYHVYKKIVVTYFCDNCGYKYVPARVHEEVNQCSSCSHKRVRCIQSLKFEKKTPYYTRTGNFVQNIITQMEANFQIYFNVLPERNMDWEWHEGIYHVAFAGGETASSEVPRVAIAKAALMTPYLWDCLQDWKNNCRFDLIEQRPITQFINNLTLRKEKQQ